MTREENQKRCPVCRKPMSQPEQVQEEQEMVCKPCSREFRHRRQRAREELREAQPFLAGPFSKQEETHVG